MRWPLALAFTVLMIGVVLGAFGAHGLKNRLTVDMMAVYQTAVQYHFWHGLGLVALAILLALQPASGFLWAYLLMAVGVLLFSGSLYALSITGIKILGAITPIGGLLLIMAWLTAAITAWR